MPMDARHIERGRTYYQRPEYRSIARFVDAHHNNIFSPSGHMRHDVRSRRFEPDL